MTYHAKYIKNKVKDISLGMQLVAQIRHEFTNYDKLARFYSYYRDKRSELNFTIGKLIKEIITIQEFHDKVDEIEAYVDLTNKSNQKRFLKEEAARLKSITFNNHTETTLKKYAKHNLNLVMHGKAVKNIKGV